MSARAVAVGSPFAGAVPAAAPAAVAAVERLDFVGAAVGARSARDFSAVASANMTATVAHSETGTNPSVAIRCWTNKHSIIVSQKSLIIFQNH